MNSNSHRLLLPVLLDCVGYLVADPSVMTGRLGADSRVALYHVLPRHSLAEQSNLLWVQSGDLSHPTSPIFK